MKQGKNSEGSKTFIPLCSVKGRAVLHSSNDFRSPLAHFVVQVAPAGLKRLPFFNYFFGASSLSALLSLKGR